MTDEKYLEMIVSTYLATPPAGRHVLYNILGLGGEVGEVLNQGQKCMRGDFPEEDFMAGGPRHAALIDELGGVLYYLHALCWRLGVTPASVMARNAAKLLDRKRRGTTRGDGDNR